MTTTQESAINFTKQLIDPTIVGAVYPDTNMTPSTTKNLVFSKTWSPSLNGLQQVLLWQPRNDIVAIGRYERRQLTGSPGVFTNVFQEWIFPDQDVSLKYAKFRTVTAGVRVWSDTISATTSAISGHINGVSTNAALFDVLQADEGSILALAVQEKNRVVQAKLEDGVIALCAPDGLNEYRVPALRNAGGLPAASGATSATATRSGEILRVISTPQNDLNAFSVAGSGLAPQVVWNITNSQLSWPNNLMGKGRLTWRLPISNGASNVTWRVFAQYAVNGAPGLYVLQSVLLSETVALPNGYALSESNVVDFDLPSPALSLYITCEVGSAWTLSTSPGRTSVSWEFYDVDADNQQSPAQMIIVSGAAADQSLSLTGSVNLQVVPDAKLSEDVKVAPVFKDVRELYVAQALFYADPMLRSIMPVNQYVRLLENAGDISVHNAMHSDLYAADFKGFMRSLIGPIAGIATALFPPLAPIVSTVAPLAQQLLSADYGAVDRKVFGAVDRKRWEASDEARPHVVPVLPVPQLPDIEDLAALIAPFIIAGVDDDSDDEAGDQIQPPVAPRMRWSASDAELCPHCGAEAETTGCVSCRVTTVQSHVGKRYVLVDISQKASEMPTGGFFRAAAAGLVGLKPAGNTEPPGRRLHATDYDSDEDSFEFTDASLPVAPGTGWGHVPLLFGQVHTVDDYDGPEPGVDDSVFDDGWADVAAIADELGIELVYAGGPLAASDDDDDNYDLDVGEVVLNAIADNPVTVEGGIATESELFTQNSAALTAALTKFERGGGESTFMELARATPAIIRSRSSFVAVGLSAATGKRSGMLVQLAVSLLPLMQQKRTHGTTVKYNYYKAEGGVTFGIDARLETISQDIMSTRTVMFRLAAASTSTVFITVRIHGEFSVALDDEISGHSWHGAALNALGFGYQHAVITGSFDKAPGDLIVKIIAARNAKATLIIVGPARDQLSMLFERYGTILNKLATGGAKVSIREYTEVYDPLGGVLVAVWVPSEPRNIFAVTTASIMIGKTAQFKDRLVPQQGGPTMSKEQSRAIQPGMPQYVEAEKKLAAYFSEPAVEGFSFSRKAVYEMLTSEGGKKPAAPLKNQLGKFLHGDTKAINDLSTQLENFARRNMTGTAEPRNKKGKKVKPSISQADALQSMYFQEI